MTSKKIKEVLTILFLTVILAAIFPAALFVRNLIDKNLPISIDGYTYDVNSKSARIFPQTDEYIDEIIRFNKLEELTVTPFKKSVTVISGSGEMFEAFKKARETWTDVTDLSCLSSFTDLTYLNISGCSVNNIDFIGQMKKLETLIINNTNVSDISVLENFENLQIIDISSCPIEDYSVLAKCENLEEVYFNDEQLPPDIITLLQEKNINCISKKGDNLDT